MEIEGGLTNNSVSWPNSIALCYPYVSPSQYYEPTSQIEEVTNLSDTQISNPIQETLSELSIQDSIITTMDNTQPHLLEYPSDKEELLKLRGELSLELLWVKQAIQSRIHYLQVLSQLQT
eukprot:TRINITY_DN376_c1_g2_i1.p1 TRINITY_DN376_c1_g2~~TRINITY_DN376_c1_g2_i1.p1  ORF type:complete len:120 (+),score=18.84 TRINITY_DN376_c1_g2_i1:3-362(+)